MSNTKLLSDQLKGLEAAIAAMPDESSLKPACQSFLVDAVSTLSELQNTHPQAHEQSERLALYLASLATCLGGHYISVISDHAEKAGENRRIANEVSRIYAVVARAKADAFWDADSIRKEYLIAEVAKEVHDIMLRENFSKTNKDGKETLTISAVRGWIAPFSPEYARRPGRRASSD